MPYDPKRHHRRSIRLPGYDYRTPGSYYITICAQRRGSIFGTLRDGSVMLNLYGQAVIACWNAIPRHTRSATLDVFVLMPDHLHGIVTLHGQRPESLEARAGARGTLPGSIPAIIQNFKSVSTRAINRIRSTPGERVWQEDYYEHIIRNAADLERIRRYIMLNPTRWR